MFWCLWPAGIGHATCHRHCSVVTLTSSSPMFHLHDMLAYVWNKCCNGSEQLIVCTWNHNCTYLTIHDTWRHLETKQGYITHVCVTCRLTVLSYLIYHHKIRGNVLDERLKFLRPSLASCLCSLGRLRQCGPRLRVLVPHGDVATVLLCDCTCAQDNKRRIASMSAYGHFYAGGVERSPWFSKLV